MRNVCLFALFAVLASGCFGPMGSGKMFVSSDYSYDADFTKYSTFYVVASEDADKNSTVAESIMSRMKLHGYKEDPVTPDLLVVYRHFDKATQLQGYMQPVMDPWRQKNMSTDDQVYSPVKHRLKEGALLVQLVDMESCNIIWQGYASDINDKRFSDEHQVRRAVRSIFDQYGYFADGYLVKHNNRYYGAP
jgi:hypothetical protein